VLLTDEHNVAIAGLLFYPRRRKGLVPPVKTLRAGLDIEGAEFHCYR
jgi:hypothetical protein